MPISYGDEEYEGDDGGDIVVWGSNGDDGDIVVTGSPDSGFDYYDFLDDYFNDYNDLPDDDGGDGGNASDPVDPPVPPNVDKVLDALAKLGDVKTPAQLQALLKEIVALGGTIEGLYERTGLGGATNGFSFVVTFDGQEGGIVVASNMYNNAMALYCETNADLQQLYDSDPLQAMAPEWEPVDDIPQGPIVVTSNDSGGYDGAYAGYDDSGDYSYGGGYSGGWNGGSYGGNEVEV